MGPGVGPQQARHHRSAPLNRSRSAPPAPNIWLSGQVTPPLTMRGDPGRRLGSLSALPSPGCTIVWSVPFSDRQWHGNLRVPARGRSPAGRGRTIEGNLPATPRQGIACGRNGRQIEPLDSGAQLKSLGFRHFSSVFHSPSAPAYIRRNPTFCRRGGPHGDTSEFRCRDCQDQAGRRGDALQDRAVRHRARHDRPDRQEDRRRPISTSRMPASRMSSSSRR